MKTLRRILKADEVAIEGPVQLSIGPCAPSDNHQPLGASAGPSVRIMQNHAEYALLEVTCLCGCTTVVRCDYAPAATAAPPGPTQP